MVSPCRARTLPMITNTNRHDDATALTTGGLDALADAASIADLRALIGYASELIAAGSAAAAAPAGGWWDELTATLGRTPTVLEVEAARPGVWWTVLRLAYANGGLAGLAAWCVPDVLLEVVAVELLEDAVGDAVSV